jgi:hypothetical protein
LGVARERTHSGPVAGPPVSGVVHSPMQGEIVPCGVRRPG